MRIENRIASGVFSVEDWWGLEQMSDPSGLNCPDCRSALYELEERRMLRFRCRSGHAYNAMSLLSAQADAREMQLSSLFGAVIEEATLAKRLAGSDEYEDAPDAGERLRDRIGLLEREAAQVADWLHATTGLVAPEPPLGG